MLSLLLASAHDEYIPGFLPSKTMKKLDASILVTTQSYEMESLVELCNVCSYMAYMHIIATQPSLQDVHMLFADCAAVYCWFLYDLCA